MKKTEYVSPNKSVKIHNMKYDNQRAVLSCLQHFQTLSVSDLAEMVHLSKTTIAKMLYSLAEKNIVTSVGKGSSTREGGKKPELFSFNADYKYTITIQMNLDYIDVAILDLNSVILYRQCEHDNTFTTYESAVTLIAKTIIEVMKANLLDPSQIYSISLCAEGIIDADNGIIRYPIHHSWPRNLNVIKDVCAKLPFNSCIFFLDSPPAYMGYSELLLPENTNLYKIVYLYTDSFSGGCILKERNIQHGLNGFVGEFGHILIDPDSSIRCSCGGKGCFESLVSKETLLAEAKRISGRDTLMAEELFEDYKNGAAYAVEVIGRSIRWYSILIHNMVLAHDPDKIIIQGVYTDCGSAFIDSLKERINALPFYRIKPNLSIEFAHLNPTDACLVGGAHHAFNHFLSALNILD